MAADSEITLTAQDHTKNNAVPAESTQLRAYCWNCKSDQYQRLFTARDFDTARQNFEVVMCSECGLSYTYGISGETLEAAYSSTYYGSPKAKFVSIVEAMVRYGQRRQAKKIIEVFNEGNETGSAEPLSVLDIGCGRGLLLQAFAEFDARCLGIERQEFPGSKPAAVDMHIGALEDEALANRRFDIIVIWHVLEHITELDTLLEELPRHLNPGGLLVVSVPNFSSWQSRLFHRHWFHLDIPRHVTHFEKPWLEEKLSAMGFNIANSITFTPTQNVYGFLQSTLNVLFPGKPNRLYHLLTRGRGAAERLSLIGWGILGGILIPFALAETLLSELAGRGATLNLYAKKEK